MADSALGSALIIPKSALEAIKRADERIQSIQDHSRQMGQTVNSAFTSMTGGARIFVSELDKIITKLGTIDSKASKMSGSLSNLGAEKAAQQVSNMNNVVAQTVENIERMSAAQRKSSDAMDMSKSIADYQKLQEQINKTAERQEYLTKFLRSEQVESNRIGQGKDGIYHPIDVANAKEELAVNNQLIASLKEEQQAIVNANKALNEKVAMYRALRSYVSDSNSLDNQRSSNTLAEMRQYYKELEKSSAQAEKQRQKEANAWLKNKEKEAQAAEKAAQREQDASDKAAAKAEKDAERIRAAQEKAYMTDWLKQQQKAYYTNTSAVVGDANSAKTLREHLAAIKELKQARLDLDVTDKNYKQNLASVNEAIKQHSKVLKEAGVNAKTLGEQTSYMAGYMSRWAQRMAFAFSVGSIKNFVEQIAEVRGQFELSERSLEAILQNKPKADEIFNKTVELAVKSPFRIKDLVDYTRQLSAYRIESDKLYDTTKRLADVSAGLGVDMGRLILAYGQVKAAAYLRGSEVRQFTEAGINMYGELQQYFKEVKGEAYTTAQIVDMISKRKVTFEDVEAIFQRMTDKGGTFYNMQEIQAETLQGKISNLKDAFDVMLNDIGKANEGTFKGMISGATVLLDNWEKIAAVGKDLVGVFGLIMLQSNKTGVSLKEMWANTGFTAYSIKGKGALGILSNSFRTLGSAAKSAGIMIKDALVSNLPLLAFASLAQLVWNAASAYMSFRDEQQKIINETIDAKKRLGELSAEYERIKDKYTKNYGGGYRMTIDKAKFQEESKSVLDSLNDELKARKLEIPIEVKEPDPAKIDKAIQAAKKKLDAFMQMAQDAKSYINGEDNSFFNSDNFNLFGIPLWADSFSKDMKELDNAANDVRQFASRAQTAIDALGEGYDKLSAKSRAAYDSIKDGAKPGELDVEYLQRVNKVMGQIFDNEAQNANFKEYADKLRKQLYGLGDNLGAVLSGSFKSAKEEATHELQGLFDNINNIYGGFLKTMKPAEVKVFWDNVATQNNLNELQKKILMTIAAKVYRFKVDSDQQSMNAAQQKIYSFMDDLQAEADRRKIKISLDVVDPKDALSTVKGFQSSAKDIKELIDQINRGQIQWFHGSALGIKQTMKWSRGNAGVNTVFDKKTAITFLREQLRNTLAKNTLAGGLDPFADNTKKNIPSKTDKAQRDILQERISLLKDMNLKYDELIKKESKETALSKTRKYFKEAAQNVGFNVNNILPDDKTTAKRIREIGAQYKELTKRGNAFRISADIDLKVSEKEYDKLKDDISRNIDDAFSQMKLYKKLKDEGMSDGLIKSMFGDLTKSFDEIQEDINNEFNKYIIKDYETTYGNDFTKWGDKVIQQYNSDLENTAKVIKQKFAGSDVEKDYLDKTQKLNQSVEQDTIETAQRLFKEYKQRLSDQLQLDRKYIEDRAAIMKNFSDPDTQKELLGNLDLDYKKKTGENTWKDFQNSDMYVRLFDNLDQVSSKALDAMADRLQQLRTELKDLDPTELKTIAEQINKVNEVRNSRNPFKAFTSGLKEMIKANKELKSLGGVDKYVELNNQKADQTTKLQMQSAYVESLQQEYDAIEKNGQAETDSGRALKLKLTTNKQIRDFMKSQLKLTDDQIAKLGTVMTEEEQAKAKFAKSVTDITSVVSTMASSFNGLFEALGGSDAQLENAMSIVDNVGSAIGSYFSGNWAGVASGVMGVATGIAKLFSNESKIDKEIQRQEQSINSLQRSYNKLKQSMDDAFDTQRLYEYNQKSVEALKAEQKSYEAMIKAEQGRKNPDDSKIQQWRDEIEDLNDTIKELEESMTEQLGGFGSQSNYKSAAEAFAEAWVDAFNEGSDALDALNDKFDEYFDNLVTKQLMNRATTKYIQPILDAFDKAVSEGSDGGNNGLDLTEKEVAKLQELKKTNLAAFDEYAKSLMEVLNIKPTGSSNISALQQGIQSVTESTAQALESILNSMRYYLATQQADVRTIRDTLLERLGASINSVAQDSSNSPVLVELRLQTTILTSIRDTLDSCVKPGHKQGGKGIKVFMNTL